MTNGIDEDKVSERLRIAIEESSLSLYRLCRRSCVDQSTIRRFLDREVDLKLATADKLCQILGVSLFFMDDESDDDAESCLEQPARH